jgi:hypothetical protein
MDISMTQCNISSGRPLAGKVSPCYGFDQRDRPRHCTRAGGAGSSIVLNG